MYYLKTWEKGIAQPAWAIEVFWAAAMSSRPQWLDVQLGQQKRGKAYVLVGQHHIQALVVVAYVFISSNWVCTTEPLAPDCKYPPQQGREEFHGHQSQMLQRDTAGNLSSMYQMQKCHKSSFI